MRLTLIPAGEFLMGSPADDDWSVDNEEPQHRVRITRPFYLGATEVTRGQFRRFVDEAGYQTEAEKDGKGGRGWNEAAKKFEQDPRYTWQNAGFEQTDLHPVVNVSWNDAVAFAEWLSHKEGKTYRLPTEAEWEYACRAGTTTRYCTGDDPEGLAAVGNIADGTLKARYPDWKYATIAARDGYIHTAPVGCYNPNAWGLFDMHGNVWEWCTDRFAGDYYKRSPADDPPGPAGTSSRVFRGGSWERTPHCPVGDPLLERAGRTGPAARAFAWRQIGPDPPLTPRSAKRQMISRVRSSIPSAMSRPAKRRLQNPTRRSSGRSSHRYRAGSLRRDDHAAPCSALARGPLRERSSSGLEWTIA